jgi:diguanylate cyclase (GGDEF)-like protein
MTTGLDSARLLAVIETQNEIAAMALDTAAVMDFVANRARELTRAGGSVIELPEGDEMVYRVATGTAAAQIGMRLKLHGSLSGLCVLEQRVLRCDDASTDERVNADAALKVQARSMICVPLRHGGHVAGVLKVTAPDANHFEDEDVALLGLLSGVIAAHMAHATDFEVVQRESLQDPLTGLANRRAFTTDLEAAIRFADRKGRALALGLLDVDRFKEVNDRHGHPVGDAVLAAVGDRLRFGRAGDKAYRLGGDEFALLMPDTDLEGARRAIRRVTALIAREPIDGVDVSVSAGCAEKSGSSAEELYSAADASLYAAKARRTDAAHA